MKQIISLLFLASLLPFTQAFAFCGFYVAKADATLFNESSQVIMVRDGQQTTITMSNDYHGAVKDFAMVVPVPVVLKKKDIRVVPSSLFSKIDAATAPRLSAYYDTNPCYTPTLYAESITLSGVAMKSSRKRKGTRPQKRDLGVKIEAKYSVGEYDIMILSAKESNGLKIWLTQEGYKIPEKAEEVLDPYIKSKLKFFVVKVNLDRFESWGFTTLNPLQITFESSRFMLPIRLGMANSKGSQDLIVYALTRNGRVETTNYRTAKMPHDRNIPLFVQNDFGPFYKETFDNAWTREGKNIAMLEYAWDISGSQPVKCDPCPSPLLTGPELAQAGVTWLTGIDPKYGNGLYNGDLFITRLHVRYNRETFPQDLAFQVTPNKTHFQCRYVIHHPAEGSLDCREGKTYLNKLIARRKGELQELHNLTGRDVTEHSAYVSSYEDLLQTHRNRSGDKNVLPIIPSSPIDGPPNPAQGETAPGILWMLGLGLIGMAAGIRYLLPKIA